VLSTREPPFPKFEASPPVSSTINKSVGSGRGSARAEKRVKAPLVRESASGSGSGSRLEAPLLDTDKKQLALFVEEGAEAEGKRGRSKDRRYPPVGCRRRTYRRWVARELRLIAESKKKRSSDEAERQDVREEQAYFAEALEKKAKRYESCGNFVWVSECEGCGVTRPESGVLHSPERSCQARTCEVCGRRRSMKNGKELWDKIEALSLVDGYSFRHITVTAKYNPWLDEDVSEDAYRERAKSLLGAIRALWKNVLKKQKGSGLYVKLEISEVGHLHAHVLHYGPYLAKPKLEKYLRKQYSKAGHTWIEQVSKGDERGAVVEVTKYVTKAPSPFCEEAWIKDGATLRLHPKLAARFEAATYRLRLSDCLGVFRGKETEDCEDEEAKAEEDSVMKMEAELPCGNCGVVGEWRRVLRDTETWIKECHSKGTKALYRKKGIKREGGPEP
jgi:hypothetical protein